MKIAESSIQLYSDTSYLEKAEKRESLTLWKNGEQINVSSSGNSPNIDTLPSQPADDTIKVSLSQKVLKSRPLKTIVEAGPVEQDVISDLNIRILKEMVERFTGKKIILSRPEDTTQVVEGEVLENTEAAKGVQEEEFGLAYDYHESYYEHEATNFRSDGKIVTEDGHEIDFSVNLNMSRDFYSEQNVSIRTGSALKDPLVINFGGTAAELTQTKFSFDIDADGFDDQISFVKSTSGFLALDVNNDSRINDGSELFGALTGNGFKELSEYDDDGNNWIDENDNIYGRLRIWAKSSEGEDQLIALGQKGVGAIYLGNISSPFSIKDNENVVQGQVRSTSVFLGENGASGTVQQIDLVA